MSTIQQETMVIREAQSSDLEELARLAQRDSTVPPEGRVLIAELGGSIQAALALETGVAIADPFKRTTETLTLLRLRADQIRGIRGIGDRERQPRRLVARHPSFWRTLGWREAAASSSRRTGVV